MKILVALVAIAAIILILRTLSSRSKSGTARQSPKNQRMLACDYCGLHVPENEAIVDGSHSYCCAQHQKLGPR